MTNDPADLLAEDPANAMADDPANAMADNPANAMADDPADFGTTGFGLDDAMITYAYRSYARAYLEFSWIEFKMIHKCDETPSNLFARFWDDIMPNLNTYRIVQDTPLIADRLLCLPNPRKHVLPPPIYEHVEEMSLFEYEKLQAEIKQRKMFAKMKDFKKTCLELIKLEKEKQPTPRMPGVSLSPALSAFGVVRVNLKSRYGTSLEVPAPYFGRATPIRPRSTVPNASTVGSSSQVTSTPLPTAQPPIWPLTPSTDVHDDNEDENGSERRRGEDFE